jgi:hypothetical protein
MALPRLRAEEIQGVYAIIPTPAKPGAESWEMEVADPSRSWP